MLRLAVSQAEDLKSSGCTALALTPGWMRSQMMLEHFGVTDVDGSRPDCWRYLLEVQEAGLPAEAAGYR